MQLRAALVQLNGCDDPEANLPETERLALEAAAPWGRVLADAGEGVGVTRVSLEFDRVAKARRKFPSFANARNFSPAQ